MRKMWSFLLAALALTGCAAARRMHCLPPRPPRPPR